MLIVLAAAIVGCQSGTPAAAPTTAAAPPAPTKTGQQPVAGGPVLLRDDITLRKVTAVDSGAIKIALSPIDSKVYLLNPTKAFSRSISLGNPPQPKLQLRPTSSPRVCLPV